MHTASFAVSYCFKDQESIGTYRTWRRIKMGLDNRPISRKDDLVVQELNGEVLIYDLRENKAFCLNETSALVWQSCDGSKTAGEIGKELGNEDMVWLALNDLKREKLVEHELTTPAKFVGMSRREVVKSLGMSSMLALPMIAALVAPVAAQGASNCGTPCNTGPGDIGHSGCMAPGAEVCGWCSTGTSGDLGVCQATCTVDCP